MFSPQPSLWDRAQLARVKYKLYVESAVDDLCRTLGVRRNSRRAADIRKGIMGLSG